MMSFDDLFVTNSKDVHLRTVRAIILDIKILEDRVHGNGH